MQRYKFLDFMYNWKYDTFKDGCCKYHILGKPRFKQPSIIPAYDDLVESNKYCTFTFDNFTEGI